MASKALTEERKETAWRMWLARGNSDNTYIISRTTGVSIDKLRVYLMGRQKQRDMAAAIQRIEEQYPSRRAKRRVKASQEKKPAKPSYTPPSTTVLLQHQSNIGVIRAVEDANKRAAARQRRDVQAETKSTEVAKLLSEIDSRLKDLKAIALGGF